MTAAGGLGGFAAHLGYNKYKYGFDMEKQSFAGLIGAGIGAGVGALNLPEDTSVADRGRYATQGALRGAGIGTGGMAGAGLGEIARRGMLRDQANPSTTRQILATLLPLLGGGLGSYVGYEIGDEFARNPALGSDSEQEDGEKSEKKAFAGASATKAEPAPNKYKGRFNTIGYPNFSERTKTDIGGRAFWSTPRNLNQLIPSNLHHMARVDEERPSAWDYLKNPLKNLATGGKYTQEKNMSRVYDQFYLPSLKTGPNPAAGNSTRKAIAPMENNPMGGYSTPHQGVLTPYPRKKQGADGQNVIDVSPVDDYAPRAQLVDDGAYDLPDSPVTVTPEGEKENFQFNKYTTVPRKPIPGGFEIDPVAGTTKDLPPMGKPSTWDYLKNPLKNLATGGRYAQEQSMSNLYDERYYPATLKGPTPPAAGNSIRKAIKPMENKPMGGYSTPTQGILTPYPRQKQGADGILAGLLGPSEEEKAKALEKKKLEKAVARNVRERMARRIAKEKTAVDAVLKSLVLEKIAESAAWQRKAGKNSEGGLNAKGRASYNKSTGGNLKAPVTSKKPKGKAKKRKASFCARMGGMKKKNTSKATANDPDSRINKSLRKWNC